MADRFSDRWLELNRTVLATSGPDRLIQDDVSRAGLRRRHIIRLGKLPDLAWLEAITREQADVSYWAFMDGSGIGHLYIAWHPDQVEGR